jgi:predicted DNA-binding WGR domain protein
VLSRGWGRIGARGGRTNTTPCDSHEGGLALFHQETKKRLKRGYLVVQKDGKKAAQTFAVDETLEGSSGPADRPQGDQGGLFDWSAPHEDVAPSDLG